MLVVRASIQLRDHSLSSTTMYAHQRSNRPTIKKAKVKEISSNRARSALTNGHQPLPQPHAMATLQNARRARNNHATMCVRSLLIGSGTSISMLTARASTQLRLPSPSIKKGKAKQISSARAHRRINVAQPLSCPCALTAPPNVRRLDKPVAMRKLRLIIGLMIGKGMSKRPRREWCSHPSRRQHSSRRRLAMISALIHLSSTQIARKMTVRQTKTDLQKSKQARPTRRMSMGGSRETANQRLLVQQVPPRMRYVRTNQRVEMKRRQRVHRITQKSTQRSIRAAKCPRRLAKKTVLPMSSARVNQNKSAEMRNVHRQTVGQSVLVKTMNALEKIGNRGRECLLLHWIGTLRYDQ